MQSPPFGGLSPARSGSRPVRRAGGRRAAGLVLLSLACFVPRTQPTQPVLAVPPPDWLFEPSGPPPPTPEARYLGKFKVTFYWVVEEKDYPAGRAEALYDARGNLVGRFSSRFVQDFKREAAARLRDGRCISYLKKANRVAVGENFLGYAGYHLTELKSIAVDPRVIPMGARVYIPAVDRVVVNGRPLTGIFYAHDIGSAVQGKHIDIFVGRRENAAAFASAGVRSLGSVDLYVLE
ncbi:MAG: 3D domain-containing protein [bacterium]